jgi:nucleoside-diphosphate-sugar epimerase
LGDSFARPRFDLVVNIMTANMVRDKALTVFGGDQMRPLIHVKDVARAIWLASIRSNAVGVYNLTHYNMCIGELARIIKDTLGYGEIKFAERECEGMDERDYSVSSDKFKKTFQMEFMYPLERAIAEIAYAIETRRVKNHKHPIFNNKLNIEERLSE